MSRIQRSDLPSRNTICGMMKPCVYREETNWCDDPRTNKGNSDAACHRLSNKELLRWLEEPKREDGS